jgi:hypothetical protein
VFARRARIFWNAKADPLLRRQNGRTMTEQDLVRAIAAGFARSRLDALLPPVNMARCCTPCRASLPETATTAHGG